MRAQSAQAFARFNLLDQPFAAARVAEKTPALRSIQAFRFLAATAVVSYHALHMLVHNAGYSFAVPLFGASGVDLFFVISGFVMVYTTQGSSAKPGGSLAFLRRRLIRVVPLYWFYTSVVILLLVFLPRRFASTRFQWDHIISSHLFLLSKNAEGGVGTVMQTGWTLCFEMYFYALFALLLALPKSAIPPALRLVFATGIVAGMLCEPPATWITVATNPILLEFLFGTVLAVLFLQGRCLGRPAAIAAMVAAVVVIGATRQVDFGV